MDFFEETPQTFETQIFLAKQREDKSNKIK